MENQQRSKSREFYQAFFEDAVTIGQELDLVVMHKDLGPTAQRVPTLLLPAKPTAMKRFVDHLEEKGFQVILDEGQQSNDLKAIADQVRDQNLESVAERLGLEPDRHDKHKWRDENHIISITNDKFHDWAIDKGGGGAIDLVMHVQECDFRTAVEWLSGQQLPKQSSPKQSQPRILQLPEASAVNWPAVKQYLTETRGLPADWIDAMHDRGLIYADQHQNAVFVRHQENRSGKPWVRGDATGACLRGTQGEPFHGLSPGSERKAGYFWLRRGQEEVKRVVLVESAIDAISLAALEKGKLAELGTTVYLSTDGSGAIPAEVLKAVLAKGGQVLVAFDADGAGEKMAWRVAGEVLGVKRMVPAVGKDWNERLLSEQHPEQGQVEQADGLRSVGYRRQMFKTLWKWYRVAGEMGHQEAYRQRITEVAREVIDGKELSEKAVQAMTKDLQNKEAVHVEGATAKGIGLVHESS